MKWPIGMCCLILAAFACTGCGYLEDRGRDAMDVFTLTVGWGGGATARVGPVHAGLYWGEDRIGLRSGEFITDKDTRSITRDGILWMPPLFSFYSPARSTWYFGNDIFFGEESMELPDGRCLKIACARGKYYYADGEYPFVYLPSRNDNSRRYPYAYYTQIEIAVGLGVSVRAGFNIGELADFVLGWFGVDIYGDDLSTMSDEEIEAWARTPRKKPESTTQRDTR